MEGKVENLSKDNKKILIITGGLGGEETEVRHLINIFNTIYPDATIDVVFLYSSKNKDWFLSRNNINFVELGFKRSLNFFVKVFNLAKFVLELTKLKIKHDYDVALSNADPSNLINLTSELIADLFTLKVKNRVIIIRFNGFLSNIGLYQTKIYEPIYKILYYITYKSIYRYKNPIATSISNAIKNDIENHGFEKGKIKVIYNPINIEEIQELKKEDLKPYEYVFKNPVLITAGRLTKQKGQWYLI
ncbi:MAG: hypothetical protein ACPLQQ_06040, partial [Caldisericum exile]